jgi:glycosyltransferase involved in cell wall biosynthesis
VIHNGIEVESFDSTLDGALFRREHKIPLGIPLVGMVGRLRPWKGQERFLRIAARISKNYPDVRFIVVGGDPFQVDNDYSNHLQRLTGELGLADRVAFTGHLRDVREALAAMDVFVHPGDPEPFGLVNIEAMAMAKPVVAFAHGALPEIVVNGQTGYLVEPVDEIGMAEAVMDLLNNSTHSEKMGKAGRSRVESYFTIQRVVSEVEAVLEAVISS